MMQHWCPRQIPGKRFCQIKVDGDHPFFAKSWFYIVFIDFERWLFVLQGVVVNRLCFFVWILFGGLTSVVGGY